MLIYPLPIYVAVKEHSIIERYFVAKVREGVDLGIFAHSEELTF